MRCVLCLWVFMCVSRYVNIINVSCALALLLFHCAFCVVYVGFCHRLLVYCWCCYLCHLLNNFTKNIVVRLLFAQLLVGDFFLLFRNLFLVESVDFIFI